MRYLPAAQSACMPSCYVGESPELTIPRKGANFGVSSASDILAIVCGNALVGQVLATTRNERFRIESVRK